MNLYGVYDFYLHEKEGGIEETKRKILDAVAGDHKDDFKTFYPSPDDLNYLPMNSVLIRFQFTLKKPYTSRGESKFSENLIVRDQFTGLPMVRPSTWKGNLRFAATKLMGPKNPIIIRLFGSNPDSEGTIKGRLYFFPTFFKDGAENDVITPLKRETRTPARGPIPLEVMKPGTQGDFYLLYVPYPGNENFGDEIKEDLKLIAEALKLMFYTCGFSAKRTSGFGVIEKQLKGKLWMRGGVSKNFSNLHELSEILDGYAYEQH